MSKDIVNKYAAPAVGDKGAELSQIADKDLKEAVGGLEKHGVVHDKDAGEHGQLPKQTTVGVSGTDGKHDRVSPSVVEKYAAPAPDADKARDVDRGEPDRG